jgi:hypothetical protein
MFQIKRIAPKICGLKILVKPHSIQFELIIRERERESIKIIYLKYKVEMKTIAKEAAAVKIAKEVMIAMKIKDNFRR